MTRKAATRYALDRVRTPLRNSERFFDTWSPEMAWCLGVVYERGAVGRDMGTVVECADLPLLNAFNDLVEESALFRNRRGAVIESPHIGDRLLDLGMDEGAFNVRRIPPVPDDCLRYLVRGILDTHGSIASFGSYLAEIELDFPSRRKACFRFMRRVLALRGYTVTVQPKEIDFPGIAKGEPAGYVYSLRLTRPREIIDCYEWLYAKPDARIPFHRAQRWIYSQLQWMLRDLQACSRMLVDEEMVSELRELVRNGKRTGLADSRRE